MNNDFQIEVDFRSGVPIYIQIMDQVKHMIATGELNSGDQLPTVRQLATDLRVNFNTVARSYKMLDEAGVISTQHGRGTFILDVPVDGDGEELRFQDLLRLTRQYVYDAYRLGYDPDEVRQVFESKLQVWLQNGEPPSPESPGENE